MGDLPGVDSARETMEKVFEGTLALTFQPAMRSSRPDATAKRYAKKYPDVRTLADVRNLSLEQRDAMQPPKFGYAAFAAGQGGASALAVTGAVVSTTVTGGTTAGVAFGALAADAVASMALMGRTIGAVATRYGYDVRLPEEELFAMGVLSLGVASSVGAKTQALAALSRLTQEMMRQATWRQLNERILVKAIGRAYALLGFRLTHRKLAQAVPLVGVGLNAALSAQLTEQTFRRAQAVYRLRALSEIYGIDPTEWVDSSVTAAAPEETETSGEEIVDVLEVLEEVRVEDDGGHERNGDRHQ
ncbi:EcsC family protein [Knoellia sp. Soil729]|uniref:EcsC family protein n=1 Tax=Knoellia sp. Soil729 TaxID=1736394 RepID=UPI00138F81F2|nr:EcsC family protein [Knoellia sp. Soil729]